MIENRIIRSTDPVAARQQFDRQETEREEIRAHLRCRLAGEDPPIRRRAVLVPLPQVATRSTVGAPVVSLVAATPSPAVARAQRVRWGVAL